jgi:ubiquinone/menaquinone biosynthesis C-methylase UbiE
MASMSPADLVAATATWNDPEETLESVNARIHDGVPLDQLEQRADRYVREMFAYFPYVTLPHHTVCMEIGSGTGYIMEALHRELIRRTKPPASIAGLDIAEHMLERARQRIGEHGPYRFLHYDGITVPLPDESFDLIYSVAALQHVPKPYVYNLFFEIRRLLRPDGFAVFHLSSFKGLAVQERFFPWREEVRRQINLETGHWHHFYSQDEVENVLKVGTGFRYVDIRQNGAIWVCAHKNPLALPSDFDPATYLELNPDVKEAGNDPVRHWQEFGHREGRRWK